MSITLSRTAVALVGIISHFLFAITCSKYLRDLWNLSTKLFNLATEEIELNELAKGVIAGSVFVEDDEDDEDEEEDEVDMNEE